MRNPLDIAILFFSRSAHAEARHKKWTGDPATDLRIARYLINHTHARLEAAPFPVFCVDETMQHGDSFGERLANAFELIFKKGFRKIIAVGNDCPDWNIDWHKASAQLIQQKSILGPDNRGGVYLIGLSKEEDFKSIFSRIVWGNSLVFQQLSALLENAHILRRHADINDLRDLQSNWVLNNLFRSLMLKKDHMSFDLNFISKHIAPNRLLRAPPSAQ